MWPYMWRFPCQKLCVSTEVYGSGRPQPYNITVEIKERALRCRPRKRWTNAYGSGKCASGKDERTALYYITHSVHGYITHTQFMVTLHTSVYEYKHLIHGYTHPSTQPQQKGQCSFWFWSALPFRLFRIPKPTRHIARRHNTSLPY